MVQKVKKPNLTEEQQREYLKNSAEPIFSYSIVMLRKDTTICSGTFAKSGGQYGILTAGHCAELIFEVERIAFTVSDLPHQLWVETKSLVHVPIEQVETYGPDLSFLIIQDVKL